MPQADEIATHAPSSDGAELARGQAWQLRAARLCHGRRVAGLPRWPRCRVSGSGNSRQRRTSRRSSPTSSSSPGGLQRQRQGRNASSRSAASWPSARSALDWGTAEILAFGTLARRGHSRALERSGRAPRHVQPSPRGALRCQHGRRYMPLHARGRGAQAKFEICNSPLSEAGVLGFEYGYSLDHPTRW